MRTNYKKYKFVLICERNSHKRTGYASGHKRNEAHKTIVLTNYTYHCASGRKVVTSLRRQLKLVLLSFARGSVSL